MAATIEQFPKVAPDTEIKDMTTSDVRSNVQEDLANESQRSEAGDEEDSKIFKTNDNHIAHNGSERLSGGSGGSEVGEDDGSAVYDLDYNDSENSDSEPGDSLSESESNDPFVDKYAKPGSSVCSYCETLLLQVLNNNTESNSYKIPDHYESFWNMKKSAETCGLCWSLIEGTEEHLESFPQRYPHDRTMTLSGYELGGGGYTLPFCNKEAIANAGIHEFTLYMGGCLDDPKFRFLVMTEDGTGSVPQRAMWSDRVPLQLGIRMPVVNEWLQACGSQHEQCNKRISDRGSLPTRLIDLFANSHTGSFDPHLITTSTLDPQNVEYTTLSHRWGDIQPVRTLKTNLQVHMTSIFPLYNRTKRRIPRTFNDAMKITRALGLRYIWIDSLCIIQDDAQDWQHEAMRMADVYCGSYLNIAAIDGRNCHDGCGLEMGWGAMSLSGPNMGGRRVRVRTTPADPVEVYSSPLNMRGWVFQELTLAPRVLYCGRRQMYWQCTEKVYSEDGYIDHTVALNIPGERYSLRSNQYDWNAWVSDFSQRQFTKQSDRLPALHGVVRHFAERTKHTFLLGLWKETLVQDLAWRTRQIYRSFSSYPTETSELAGVPSWSWLKLHVDKYPGGIVYFSSAAESTATTQVKEVEVLWESIPLFSKIASTKLVLQGPLKKHRFQWDCMRRRLFGKEGEDSPDTDYYVVRLDEMLPEDVEYDEKREY
ncbi:hypothetical protein DPSP01_010305 [Paraphaeosphaeria sporulosa]